MNIYISSDMEGIAQTREWSDVRKAGPDYKKFQNIQTNELKAMAECLFQQDKIMIRDGHGSAKNILKNQFPSNVEIIDYWDKDPTNMMKGINLFPFDFAVLHGYHAAGSSGLSPLAHTFSSRNFEKLTLNGEVVGETTFSILTAAYFHIPVVYISGDNGAVAEAKKLCPNIIGTIVKDFSIDSFLSPEDAINAIKTDFNYALQEYKKNPQLFDIKLPDSFEFTLEYKDTDQVMLHIKSLPNVFQSGENTLCYKTSDFYDLLSVMRLMKQRIDKRHWIVSKLNNAINKFARIISKH